MERMWRKVNQGLTSRSSSNKNSNQVQSTDTASSAGFGEQQNVVAVSGRHADNNNVSASVLAINQSAGNTASSEKRRRRRRKSRPRRDGDGQLLAHHRDQSHGSKARSYSHSGMDSGSVAAATTASTTATTTGNRRNNIHSSGIGPNAGSTVAITTDSSLKQRAVAKLRMLNFHLNWDLHMSQCKPCGPRTGGNIWTRRLCRNRRREDNELYRSNSFKFERFERKDGSELGGSETLRKQISVCDDYSLPIDFVKKRPSSFDPCLAEHIPHNWTTPSPVSEHQVTFFDQKTVQTEPIKIIEGYSDPKDSKKNRYKSSSAGGGIGSSVGTFSGDIVDSLPQTKPLIVTNLAAAVTSTATTVTSTLTTIVTAGADLLITEGDELNQVNGIGFVKNYTHPYSSDTSGPKTSEEEFEEFNEDDTNKIPELNSPDSISEDLVRPLQSHKSPKRTLGPETSKRNPSPYYYSDLLKNREENTTTKSCDVKAHESLLIPRSVTSLQHPQQQSHHQQQNSNKYRKSNSLDTPEVDREVCLPKRYSITEDGVRIIRCDSPSTTTSDDSDCTECQKRREWHANALALVQQTCNVVVSNPSMPPHRLLGPAVCACAVPDIGDDIDDLFRPRSIFYVHQPGVQECSDCTINTIVGGSGSGDGGGSCSGGNNSNSTIHLADDEMTSGRTRQIYETAFDCKIAKSDDDLDEMDRLSKHSVLLQLNNCDNNKMTNNSTDTKETRERIKFSKAARAETKRAKNSNKPQITDTGGSGSTISQELENMHIDDNIDNINNANTTSSSQLPFRGYTPSPPSTAPLPVKFPGKHDRFFMNSIKSAPNLPSSNGAQHPRLKNLRLNAQSLRGKEIPISSEGSIIDSTYNSSRKIERPRSVLASGRVLELKRSHHISSHSHQRGRNYSSTESMATSSSGGSMESLRSSTSEGNRSTSSSESRHSTSLSSHSSDSGPSISYPLRAPTILHSKLHILSPISDKSSQEPASETSDINNRNNNSQKPSPDETTCKITTEDLTVDNAKAKKRLIQNKTLLIIKGDEIQGSDSGISLHSRDGAKSRSAFQTFVPQKINLTMDNNVDNNPGLTLPQELNDLPFDMPKLRRRQRIVPQQVAIRFDACTSGSATSVDLGDLPFDMPKLRRRLRLTQPQMITDKTQTSTESSGISQASSSHSMREDRQFPGARIFRQNLTLNLNEIKGVKKIPVFGFNTAGRGLNLNLGGVSGVDVIDISLPLDRQGWYHGAISRVEAENTLRALSEGSFLVRNSESTRQDYSLSLKGAKGFMHMRIQKCAETGQFILGQFSRPFDSIPEMIRHFCLNRLPVRGAEHMCLVEPVIAQLL